MFYELSFATVHVSAVGTDPACTANVSSDATSLKVMVMETKGRYCLTSHSMIFRVLAIYSGHRICLYHFYDQMLRSLMKWYPGNDLKSADVSFLVVQACFCDYFPFSSVRKYFSVNIDFLND